MDDNQRDEIARILEMVVAEGIDHPRNLDAALDAIADTVDPFNRLSPAEAERLSMLAEEAGEVVKAVGKILRHGYDSYNPDNPSKGTNRLQLEEELCDLIAVASAMIVDLDINISDHICSKQSLNRWMQKLKYAHHQRPVHGA